MDDKLKKLRREKYIKGLLMRIIFACLLFILLFVGKQFSVEIGNLTTDQVIESVQDHSLVDSIQTKIQGWFTNIEE